MLTLFTAMGKDVGWGDADCTYPTPVSAGALNTSMGPGDPVAANPRVVAGDAGGP